MPPEITGPHFYTITAVVVALLAGQVAVLIGFYKLLEWFWNQVDKRLDARLDSKIGVDALNRTVEPIVEKAVGRNFEHINRSVMDLKGEATRASDSAAAAHRRLDAIGAPRTVP